MRPFIAAILALLTGVVAAYALEQRGEIDQRNVAFDEPALTSLLKYLLPPSDKSSASQTVTLNRLRFDYQSSADKIVIRNGTVCHDAFAATMDGYVELPDGDLHFYGVLWLAMGGVAPLRNSIPFFGSFAHNAANANAVPVAVSYQVTGSGAAPLLRINPFADEYPGALRRVTEFCGGR
jgi:hypothetical protein